MQTGIDVLMRNNFKILRGRQIALCTSHSVCDSRLVPVVSIFMQQKICRLKAIFSPEHGFFADLQDQKPSRDRRLGSIPVYSQYGPRLAPAAENLHGIDTIVIDLFDIGVRYYTFLWTAILLMKKAARLNIPVVVLDRPNPLNGVTVQGPVLDPAYASFVGLYPIPIRHGLTLGEIMFMINCEHHLQAHLKIVLAAGWKRNFFWRETKLPWTMPSPNMPSWKTALLYPGLCLLEGTNVSEGRGTTKPFELLGAPWIDPDCLVRELSQARLKGVKFRPAYFRPTFHKHQNCLCGGVQIFITDPHQLDPVRLGLTLISVIRHLYPSHFQWRLPPYEKEKIKLPFDILIGNSWVRRDLEKKIPLTTIEKRWQKELDSFLAARMRYLLYR